MSAATPLLLLGAAGLASEVLAAVRAAQEGRWTVLGALDDDPRRHGTELDGVAVFGGTELVHEHPDALAVLCMASPRRRSIRLDVVRRLDLPAHRWATVVHPGAALAAGTVLGEGCVLLAHAVVTAPVRIGAHLLAMPQVLITHDDVIGEGVTMAGRATLGGGATVHDGAYLGSGCLVREGVTIGAGALVGMGAVVLRDVPAGETWAGNPARRLPHTMETT